MNRLVLSLMLVCSTAYPQSTSPKGSFGFLLNSWQAQNNTDSGSAVLGVMNLDGAGSVTGSLTLEKGAVDATGPQNLVSTFTGTYSVNPDATGSMTITLNAVPISASFALVFTNSGQRMQLLSTGLTGGDPGGAVLSGEALLAYAGPLKGSYGFELTNSPSPTRAIGVATFDGAGNATLSYTSVDAPPSGAQPPVSLGNIAGTYSTNADGSGAINAPGGSFGMVVTDGGSGLMLLLTSGTTTNVVFGTARLQ